MDGTPQTGLDPASTGAPGAREGTGDRLLRALEAKWEEESREAVTTFARRLLARGLEDFVERRGIPRAVADICKLFRFIERTPRGEIAVRVRPLTEEGPQRAVLETVMPDRPFIVNTIREYLHSEGLSLPHIQHPVVVLRRDEAGRVLEVLERDAEGPRTSIVYVFIEGLGAEERCEAIEGEVRERLHAVRTVTTDFDAMLERSAAIIRGLEAKRQEIPWRAAELDEVCELLRWMEDGNFLFLGHRTYDIRADGTGRQWIQAEAGSGLGILREDRDSRYFEPQPLDELPPDLRARVLGGPLLIVSKTNAESPIQRQAQMDYIGIKRLGADGTVCGEYRFLGLFTARAFGQDASEIPILRRKLQEILESERAERGSHDYQMIVETFNSMPKEELFLASVGELTSVIHTVMETEGADDVRISVRPDPLGRGVNLMVIVPKDRFSGDVRREIQAQLVEAYEGEVLNYHLALGGSDQARLHFYLASGLPEVGIVDVRRLERAVRESVQTWDERLYRALEAALEPERAHDLAREYQGRFSEEYMATVPVETAVEDLERLVALETTGELQASLERAGDLHPDSWRLKVFTPRGALVLSDVVPTLENVGFRVLEADRFGVGHEPGTRRSIHVFEVEVPDAAALDREAIEPRLASLLRAVRSTRADDDSLNGLILSAGLEWRPVSVLRAYAGYAFQIGAVVSRSGVRRALTRHPELARLLYEMFEARFDPAIQQARGEILGRLEVQFGEALQEVAGIEDDRTLRRLLELVQKTLRTNYFRAGFDPTEHALALKIDCRAVSFMPSPSPRFEVYVHSPRTEGAHLRFDEVARGGIRWSDRTDDFRVEVLGLAKTQQIKNAVIVPAGAKGAFVVRRAVTASQGADSLSREELLRSRLRSYREFIHALLDLTDNVVDEEVRHPADTVVHDEDDPYLVVAADKGTATLSDTANEIAGSRGFWLGDAFASGGKHGYDHKAMGITARGAWECVQRHFRELGLDTSRPFTAVGIGDMSGDVFGNGMLLSREIELVAAFDHRHIFVDPDPDPERSWEERRRLFELGGSCWTDYDPAVVSEGGGVFDRAAKRIQLSERTRERLGIEETDPLNGESLIRAILCAPVDLLWNGGIGTYVKARDETHAEVGDPENDRVRVDGEELRARVVGEGGNLGFTQRGRIEYARHGGRLNTDALDNSAGVDTSDHEVNLKILFRPRVGEALTPERRNELLRSVADDVAADVLSNNYSQSLAVSLDRQRSRSAPDEFRTALAHLEREGQLDCKLEELPTTEELLERQEAGEADGLDGVLTRPELAVMLGYSKLHLKSAILGSDLPDDPGLLPLLRAYFPDRAIEALGSGAAADGDSAPDGAADGGSATDGAVEGSLDGVSRALETHRLRRNIVATVLTNRLVDRMGAAFHVQVVTETGASAARVAKLWHVAGRLVDVEALFASFERTDGSVPADRQYRWWLEASAALANATRWLLAQADGELGMEALLDRYRDPVVELRVSLPELMLPERRATLEARAARYEEEGLPEDAARHLASLTQLHDLLPIAELSWRTGLEARLVGEVYCKLAREIDFPWIRQGLERLPVADGWSKRAAKSLERRLDRARAEITTAVLDVVEGRDEVGRGLAGLRRRHRPELETLKRVLRELQATEGPGLAGLMVAVEAVEKIVEPTE